MTGVATKNVIKKVAKLFVRFKIKPYLCTRKSEMMAG